jgi:hypothetical protein
MSWNQLRGETHQGVVGGRGCLPGVQRQISDDQGRATVITPTVRHSDSVTIERKIYQAGHELTKAVSAAAAPRDQVIASDREARHNIDASMSRM